MGATFKRLGHGTGVKYKKREVEMPCPPIQLQVVCLSFFAMLCCFTILFTTPLGTLGHDEFAEMHLHPNPVFSIPSDNIYMTCMTGTKSGRIFLGGKDGCVYEVAYQVSKLLLLVN